MRRMLRGTFRAGVAAAALIGLSLTGLTLTSLSSGGPAFAQSVPIETSGAQYASHEAPRAERHMVAAANPHASAAGLEILRAGGSAVDAAIAMQLVLSLVEPQSSGVGGGGFLLTHDAKAGRTTSYDGRESAPQSATPALFLGADGKPLPFAQAFTGGRVVGIPGTFRLMELAHRQHGKLKWAALFQPAIRLAEQGFAISPRMFSMLESAAPVARDFPEVQRAYFGSDGKPLPVGTVLKTPDYAALLKDIAARGADAYYTGKPAERAIKAITQSPKAPVEVTKADFANYKAIEREAVCGTYRAYKICGMGPPSSAATTLIATLKMLERFDLKALGPKSPEAIHLIAEATALAYADRGHYLADPAYVQVPVKGLIDNAYLAERAKLIDPRRATNRYPVGTPPMETKAAFAPHAGPHIPSTTHFVAVDANGNAASWTASVQAPFGSFLMVDGYLLNNELTDFSFVPEANGQPVANRAEAGKRPRSSMAPTLVFDGEGRLVLAVGSAGGSRIITHVLKTVIANLDWGMDIQKAISFPNFHKDDGGTLEIERGSALEALRPQLEAMGHMVALRPTVSGLQGIQLVRDASGKATLLGGADPRREGVALGD
ncbi:MAG TPA: gamma-glutamyltransferase [Pedomonas sp.]|uniref:gamma-glutamyltransferase n=1 Tax=Pedomonas sp. TaxID=2976421 RepID=UPI002F3F0B6C